MLEKEVEEEYHRVAAKDREAGKDFNKTAYEQYKINKYHFQYLKMQEKMYNYEQTKGKENIEENKTSNSAEE